MASTSSDEWLNELVNKLGEERGNFVKLIQSDVFHLRSLWREYKALFGANEQRVDLLNSVAGNSVYWIESCMFESVMMAICRLRDPEFADKAKKQRNISVHGLQSMLSKGPDPELARLLSIVEDKSQFVRSWRNKKIGHSDFITRVNINKLHSASRKAVREAIDAIAACIKRFSLVELNVTLVTHPVSALEKDSVSLLEAIYLGKIRSDAIKKEKNAAIEEGKWDLLKSVGNIPEWVSFRPQDELDL